MTGLYGVDQMQGHTGDLISWKRIIHASKAALCTIVTAQYLSINHQSWPYESPDSRSGFLLLLFGSNSFGIRRLVGSR